MVLGRLTWQIRDMNLTFDVCLRNGSVSFSCVIVLAGCAPDISVKCLCAVFVRLKFGIYSGFTAIWSGLMGYLTKLWQQAAFAWLLGMGLLSCSCGAGGLIYLTFLCHGGCFLLWLPKMLLVSHSYRVCDLLALTWQICGMVAGVVVIVRDRLHKPSFWCREFEFACLTFSCHEEVCDRGA